MTPRQESYPATAEQTQTFVSFVLNVGMADFMWNYITGQQLRLPPDQPTRLRYNSFINRRIKDKTAEEIGMLLIEIQDFKDTVDEYTDDNFVAADFIILPPATQSSQRAA